MNKLGLKEDPVPFNDNKISSKQRVLSYELILEKVIER